MYGISTSLQCNACVLTMNVQSSLPGSLRLRGKEFDFDMIFVLSTKLYLRPDGVVMRKQAMMAALTDPKFAV